MDSTSESFFVIFILITCGGLFAAIWLGILFLVSRFGGWNRLYKCYKFPFNAQKPFKVKKFQSIQLGLSNYNGVMTLSLSKKLALRSIVNITWLMSCSLSSVPS